MSDLRIGVIGIGARADLPRHVREFGAQITVAADPSPHAPERLERKLGTGIHLVKNTTEAIAYGMDAAFVTSPDHTHADITCELLTAGIPVYLEKPIATTTEAADRVLTTAYETGTKLYVGHNMRHMDVVRTMKKLIDDGAIGQVKAIWTRHFVGNGGDYYFKDWHAERQYSTSLLLQKGAHDIDVMHWLAGSQTREVTAMGDLMVYDKNTDRADNSHMLMGDWLDMSIYPPAKQRGLNPIIDVEDISMMLMRMDSGVLGSYQQCHFTPDYWRNYTIIGDEGRIENFGDSIGGTIKLWNTRSGWRADADLEIPIGGDETDHGGADLLTVGEFIRFITDGGPTDTNPLSARDSVAAGVAAAQSLRQGSIPITIPTVDNEISRYFTQHQVR